MESEEKKKTTKQNSRELRERLYSFSLRIVKFVRSLPRHWVALEIGRQLLRSGISIDANYEEACGAFSRADFAYRLNVAFKEAKESHYWLRLLYDAKISTGREMIDLIQESKEIRNILGKGAKTARKSRGTE